MTRKDLQFTVYGKPATSGSKTGSVVRRKDGSLGVVLRPANKRQKPYQKLVAGEAVAVMAERGLVGTDGPVRLEVLINRQRPLSHYVAGDRERALRTSAPAQPCVTPDSLKVVRAIEDALNGIAYRDDKQIVEHIIKKRYASLDSCLVRVVPLAQEG